MWVRQGHRVIYGTALVLVGERRKKEQKPKRGLQGQDVSGGRIPVIAKSGQGGGPGCEMVVDGGVQGE